MFEFYPKLFQVYKNKFTYVFEGNTSNIMQHSAVVCFHYSKADRDVETTFNECLEKSFYKLNIELLGFDKS